MGLHYKNLDETTRKYMLEEVALGDYYKSPRIREEKMSEYLALLTEAIRLHTDDWLASRIRERGLLRGQETRILKSGPVSAKVPHNAAQQLAEGEFNRFYLRGLAARAIQEGKTNLRIYRGRASEHPRPESEDKIGMLLAAIVIQAALRKGDFVDNALGLPAGPNSGLTAELAE